MPIQESEAVPRILEADAELPNRKSVLPPTWGARMATLQVPRHG